MNDEVKKLFEMYQDKKSGEVLAIFAETLFFMLIGSKVPPSRANMLIGDFIKHFTKMLQEAKTDK